jgi:hypothetical protein
VNAFPIVEGLDVLEDRAASFPFAVENTPGWKRFSFQT